MEPMGKHTIAILTEMCDRVNAKYKDIDFKKDNWFWEYSWSKGNEQDFIKWIIKYLTENKEAQREVINPPFTKKNIKKAAEFFVWNYGWKIKQ